MIDDATGDGPVTPAAEIISELADRLERATRDHVPCTPVRDVLDPSDLRGAYGVQQEVVRRRLSAGDVVVGRKIGLTSPAVQAQLGVDQPDFGVLFADMDASHTVLVDSGRLLQPRIEAEIAFVLSADLDQDDLSIDQVRGSVGYAVAALEIVDSRIAGWDITLADTVADNASSGLYVLGERQLTLDEFDPVQVQMTLQVDGVQVSTGSGAACLGDPLLALAWLARTARDFGDPLRAGQVILSGALGPMVATPPGTHVTADLGPLGTVAATFSTTTAGEDPA